MRAAFVVPVASALSLLIASTGHALTLGTVTQQGRIGQPLDFTVTIRLDADEAITSQCVSADVVAGETPLPQRQVHTRLLPGKGLPNEVLAHVATTRRLNEPVVTVTLSVGCPAKLSHKFVTLLDPPLPKAAATRSVATPGMGSAEYALASGTAQTKPVTLAASPSSEARPPADEQERLRSLEQQLEAQRRASQATEQALATLQQRLRQAESARRGDPKIVALTTLVLVLLAAVGVLLWRLARAKRQAAWSEETTNWGENAMSQVSTAEPSVFAVPAFDEATMTSMRVLPEPQQLSATAPQAISPGYEAARTRRTLSMEAIIDLEQQADFLIVLGQEDAAIDLLMGHVRSSGGTSPMPYLKLLQIYRGRGEADSYDRIRERFNRRFNGHAPAWDAIGKDGRTLADYPETVAQLQSAWATSSRAADLLEALLLRRDSSAEPFELPAYEELLFLYAVARDELEHEPSPGGVDLLLPLGHESEAPSIVHAQRSRSASTPVPGSAASVDLDLDFNAAHRTSR